jgi:large subunit ribosomal protein L5
MSDIKISKVTVNVGVGESGEKLGKAETLLQQLLEQKPVRTISKGSHPEFGVKKREPIGAKVTLRKEKATAFLKNAFEAIENTVKAKQFDSNGNLSFGIQEYIELPGTKYDPDIGMFGMDVCVNLERRGYRIAKRKKQRRKVAPRYRITPEEAVSFFKENFKVQVQ